MVSGKKERGYLPSNIMPGLRITILVRKTKKKKKPHDFEANSTDREETRDKNNRWKRRTPRLRGEPGNPGRRILKWDMEPFGTCERKWATMHARPFNHNNADHNLRRNAQGDKIKR
jgi:hypothetical protein